MPEPRLRAALVGGGWVSLNRHLPAARAQREVELVGLVTQTGHVERVDRDGLGRRFGLRRFGESLTEPWFRDEVDAVFIGTPPETHEELAKTCLEMGKHVLVEKPMALTVVATQEMMAAAKKRKRCLGVVHNFQFARAPKRALASYHAGRLGALRAVLGFQSSNQKRRLPVWYRELPLGLFTDESPHLLYLTSAVLPDLTTTSIDVGPPIAANDNTPTHVLARLESSDGVPATLSMFFTGALSEWHLVLLGSKRTALVDLFRDIYIELPDDGGHGALDVLRTSLRGLLAHVQGFVGSGFRHASGRMDYGNREVFRRFTAGAREGRPMPGIEPENGQAVVRLMEQIHEAARARRRRQ